MDAPKRIWAWPHFDGWITGDWSANTYHDERTVAYILATEHERIVAEKDAEIAAARDKALEEAANVAATGWVSADYDVVGIADADTAMRLCEHIAATIRAMKGDAT